MTDEELKTLIVDGKTGILHGFTSRFGKPFEAGLELNDKFRATLYFPAREEDEAAGTEEAVKVASVTIPDMGEHDVMETGQGLESPFPGHWKGKCRRLRFPGPSWAVKFRWTRC